MYTFKVSNVILLLLFTCGTFNLLTTDDMMSNCCHTFYIWVIIDLGDVNMATWNMWQRDKGNIVDIHHFPIIVHFKYLYSIYNKTSLIQNKLEVIIKIYEQIVLLINFILQKEWIILLYILLQLIWR